MQQILCNNREKKMIFTPRNLIDFGRHTLLRAQRDGFHFDSDAQTLQLYSLISIFYLEVTLHNRTKPNQYEYGLVFWPIAMLLAMFLERLQSADRPAAGRHSRFHWTSIATTI